MYQTADPPKIEPQVGKGLFRAHLLILHFKSQFSKSIKSSTFFLNLIYPLRRNFSFPGETTAVFELKRPRSAEAIYRG